MKKRNLLILSLILILTLTTTILVTADTKETNKIPMNGVIVCGTKIPCGVSDSICPENFVIGYYCKIPDSDCGGLI
jgi:hypothetical protein